MMIIRVMEINDTYDIEYRSNYYFGWIPEKVVFT